MPLLLILLGLPLGAVISSLADNLPPDAEGQRHGLRAPRCQACGRPHQGVLRLALAGLLLRRGRCEHCGAPRRWRPVVVELVTAAALPWLWGWAQHGAGGPAEAALRFAGGAVVALCLLLITVIDVEHRLILRNVVFASAALIVLTSLVLPGRTLASTLLGGVVGYGAMFAVFGLAQLYGALMARLRGRPLEEEVFGGGDVNLAGVVGLAVGWPAVTMALIIAVVAGGAFSLAYIVVQLLRRRYTPHAAIPYGPFLVVGAAMVYYYGTEVLAWYLGG